MSLPVAILAGGVAKRLRPLTDNIPKALIEINGKPFLAYQLELLSSSGITEVVICTWFKEDQIRAFAGDGSRFGININYSFDGEQPLGTGGAVKKALSFLGDSFFILYGDSYLPCDYHMVEKTFFSSKKDGLMTVYHNKDLGDRSNVQFEKGKILAYDKDNRSSIMEYIDYGLGILRSSEFEAYPESEAFDLAEIYQKLIMSNRLAGLEIFEKFYEIGSFSGLKELENYLNHKSGRIIE
jgi:N-acetyl-alpha-D-muramate 1-phosphate uridylyltransferase